MAEKKKIVKAEPEKKEITKAKKKKWINLVKIPKNQRILTAEGMKRRLKDSR